MKIHYLQHVPFENLANIEIWARKSGYSISRTRLFLSEDKLPKVSSFDWLMILGGPMNIYEEIENPWLHAEKKLIEQAIKKQKLVLGICLGAQLIADVLGGSVTKNKYKEIGWHPVSLTPEAKKSFIFKNFPAKFQAFHWHGDTFQIPHSALHVAKSEGCTNQAFDYNGHVVGLQFHLESSLYSIKRLIKYCPSDLTQGKYIETLEEMLNPKNISGLRPNLHELLNQISKSLITVA